MEYDAKQDIDYHLCIYYLFKILPEYVHDCHTLML